MNKVRNPELETTDCLKARLIELDLLEQALNEGRDMKKYKLQRLTDIKSRLKRTKFSDIVNKH